MSTLPSSRLLLLYDAPLTSDHWLSEFTCLIPHVRFNEKGFRVASGSLTFHDLLSFTTVYGAYASILPSVLPSMHCIDILMAHFHVSHSSIV
jgi:hypothetical protein